MFDEKDKVLNLLYWIRDHENEWENIFNYRGLEADHNDKWLQDYILLGEIGQYEILITLVTYSATEEVAVEVLKKFTIEYAIQEVEKRGAKAVFEEFIELYKQEQDKYHEKRNRRTGNPNGGMKN